MAESKPKAKKKPEDNPSHIKHLRNMLSTYRGLAGPTHPLMVPHPSEAGLKGQVSEKVQGDNIMIPAKTGEYIIPEPVVRRKGTQFFDNLIKKCLEETIPAGRDKGQTVAQAEKSSPPTGYQQGGEVDGGRYGGVSNRLNAARDFYAGTRGFSNRGDFGFPSWERSNSGLGRPSFEPGGSWFNSMGLNPMGFSQTEMGMFATPEQMKYLRGYRQGGVVRKHRSYDQPWEPPSTLPNVGEPGGAGGVDDRHFGGVGIRGIFGGSDLGSGLSFFPPGGGNSPSMYPTTWRNYPNIGWTPHGRTPQDLGGLRGIFSVGSTDLRDLTNNSWTTISPHLRHWYLNNSSVAGGGGRGAGSV